MTPFRFSRCSEARRNRKDRGRKSFQRTKASRLSFEPLEFRQMLSASPLTTFNFNVPVDVAPLGVQVGLYSNTSGMYLDSAGNYDLISSQTGSLPLITLVEQGTTATEPIAVSLEIPSGQTLPSAEMFIFIGTVNTGLTISNGQVSAASATADPTSSTQVDNFAQIEFNYTLPNNSLDIDTSSIDSTGYPFTVVYPKDCNLAYPLHTLGITVSQTNLNTNFQNAFKSGGQYEDYSEFEQCATFDQQQFPDAQQVVAPQDIMAIETTLPAQPTTALISDPTSTLVVGDYYYYSITAVSDNVIANSGGALGETLLSNYQTSGQIGENQSVALTWGQYYDPNTAGYNIYRWSTSNPTETPTDATLYSLIKHVSGASTTSFTDNGVTSQSKQISADTAMNYGFNPLSEYYTTEIEDFFTHYSATNSFVIHTGDVAWMGNTVTYTPTASWNTTHASYTVLQLTAQSTDTSQQINQGDVINIYEPFFTTNTSYLDVPTSVMPSWLSAHFSPYESPAQMVFACNGVFATNTYDPDLVGKPAGDATALATIENCISAAFNRGIATNSSIPPDNWSAFPQMLSAPEVGGTGSQVTTMTTYYYAVTAVNQYGETTPSLEVSAMLAPGQSATLYWANGANATTATSYKIYRGTTPGNLTLLATVQDQTFYTDDGSTSSGGAAPTFQYFATGTTSNWYAAFVQTNSLLYPDTGVSLNGMAYGFPYSDQGGLSTNITFTTIPSTIAINLSSYSDPTFVTQTLPDAIVGTAYQQSILVSGLEAGMTYSTDTLPDGFTLDSDTGLLSCSDPTTAGDYNFTVQILDSGHTAVAEKSFTLTVDPTGVAEVSVLVSPLSVVNQNTSSMTYTFRRNRALSGALTVNFTVGGTATYLTNYTESGAATFSSTGGTVVIADGATSATVIITPTGASISQNETAILTVTSGTDYVVGSPSVATGTILAADQESTIGLYSSFTGMFYLRGSNTTGEADLTFQYGPTETDWIAVAGDWNGDGVSTIGLYSQASAKFFLRNENSEGVADLTFQYGPTENNWLPVVGDWNGDGIDTIGLYNPTSAKFFLRNENSAGNATMTFYYGPAGNNWLAVAGDWNGDGVSTIGLYSQTSAKFFLRNENSTGVADVTFQYGPTENNFLPMTGDWNGGGTSTIGLYHQTSTNVFLRNENTEGVADTTFQYGPAGNHRTPITGNWGDLSGQSLTTCDVAGSGKPTSLTQTELDTITSEAIKRWQASGIHAEATAKLEAATIKITDLTGSNLAMIENGVIYLDRTAAGHGWFVDSTPSSDEEYTATVSGVTMYAKSSTEAVDHIDLLTLVEQELGKIAGLEDLTDGVAHNQIGVSSRSSLLAAG